MPYTEASYEKAIIQLFEEMDYRYICGYDIDRDYKCLLYMDELKDTLCRLNPALHKLTNFKNCDDAHYVENTDASELYVVIPPMFVSDMQTGKKIWKFLKLREIWCLKIF